MTMKPPRVFNQVTCIGRPVEAPWTIAVILVEIIAWMDLCLHRPIWNLLFDVGLNFCRCHLIYGHPVAYSACRDIRNKNLQKFCKLLQKMLTKNQ